MARWLGPICAGACAALLAASPGGAARPTVITVKFLTTLRMADTDIYCSITRGRGKNEPWRNGVVCMHQPGGPRSETHKGYAITADDKGIGVISPDSTKVLKLVVEPQMSKVPLHEGGVEYSVLVTLQPGAYVHVSGTHMSVVGLQAASGGRGIGVAYTDAAGDLIVGTKVISISNHFVTIAKATAPHATKIVYSHPVY
jgi:hypothetical protein